MKTLQEINRELKNVHKELTDPDLILDPEWREFLENKSQDLLKEREAMNYKEIIFIPITGYPYPIAPFDICLYDLVDEWTGMVLSFKAVRFIY